MYSWIWDRLPGGTTAKLAASLALLAALTLVLLLVVFPSFDGAALFTDVTVGE